ncbi:histidine kinase [Agriterribacter sp.]|uniref:sensor histidine kinase n=1 Tax=Agriterribacter sp. TaxID=2821509 RepID=UPI002CBBDA41|nr:histidine kinase [Agriterribacter sp.]HRP58175.1 histidine kinase [Agriterribacter sp.]
MQIKKLEPWGAVTILLIYMFVKAYESVSFSSNALLHKYGQAAIRNHLVFDYYKYYLIPQLIIVVVIAAVLFALNFKILPQQLGKKNYMAVAGSFFISFVVVFLVVFICNTWLRYPLYAIYDTKKGADMQVMKESFGQTLVVFLLFTAYYLCKMLVAWLYNEILKTKPAYKKLFIEIVVTGWSWIMLLGFSFVFREYIFRWVPAFVLVLLPFFITLFFLWAYFFLPRYAVHAKKRKLLFPSLLIIIVFGIPLFVLFAVLSEAARNEGVFFSVVLFVLGLLLVTWFLARFHFDQQREKSKEIQHLKETVSQKSADIDFLRSQINPHFLFNALNTIYGTALQENADRTAEGVQKLGDMMRFMLQENQEEKIPLDKEINYLTNYIDLQRLRTLTSPDIAIDLTIKDKDCRHYIAPMLLIPFVENAFKHGISLKEKSWIKINISCDTENLYFDVYNSVHLKKEDDPEKNRSGIGLENVKQRLSLLYPGQHELHIRSTNTEYFIHLTIRL